MYNAFAYAEEWGKLGCQTTTVLIVSKLRKNKKTYKIVWVQKIQTQPQEKLGANLKEEFPLCTAFAYAEEWGKLGCQTSVIILSKLKKNKNKKILTQLHK